MMNKITGMILTISLFILTLSACSVQPTDTSANIETKQSTLTSDAAAGKAYPYGLSGVWDDQEAYLAAQYAEWKGQYITSSGAGGYLRVQRDSGSQFDTVSEGIGYGMLLAVYYKDQTTLNGLWNYYKLHLNSNGFMNWQIDKNGNTIGQNGATDADEDVAAALCFASKVWGSAGSVNYAKEATSLINKMMTYEVEANTFILKPGDMFGGSSIL